MPQGLSEVFSTDTRLTNYSLFYKNESFIAERLFPVQPAALPDGKYYVYGREHQKAHADVRAPGSPASLMSNTLTTASYTARERALGILIPDEHVDFSDQAVDPLRDSTEELMEALMVNIEIDCVAEIDATSDFPTNHSATLSGTDQWSDYTNSDPLGDAADAHSQIISQIGRKANVFVCGQEVWDKLQFHPQILQAARNVGVGRATPELVASLFNVDEVLIGSAVKNTALEGQSDSLGFVWGKDAWFFYRNPNLGLRSVTFGRHFSRPLARAGGQRQVVETIDSSKRIARVVRVRKSCTYNDIATACGYVYKSAVA